MSEIEVLSIFTSLLAVVISTAAIIRTYRYHKKRDREIYQADWDSTFSDQYRDQVKKLAGVNYKSRTPFADEYRDKAQDIIDQALSAEKRCYACGLPGSNGEPDGICPECWTVFRSPVVSDDLEK